MGISSTSSMLDQLTVKDNLDICGQCSGRASSFVQQSLTFFPGHGGVLIGEDEANGYHICQHPAEAGGGGGGLYVNVPEKKLDFPLPLRPTIILWAGLRAVRSEG